MRTLDATYDARLVGAAGGRCVIPAGGAGLPPCPAPYKIDAEGRAIIKGNTYEVKDELKAMGGRWNPDARCWTVPASRAAEAEDLVGNAEERISCWECGGRYTHGEVVAGGGDWKGQHCGC
jgi:hypothetical protein